MRHRIIPVFIPHASCPERCVFCDQNRIAATEEHSIESIKKIIADGVAGGVTPASRDLQSREGSFNEVAFYGGSFTAIAPETQVALLSLARPHIESGAIDSVRVSTRPDCIDDEILTRLEGFGVKTIELGVQSMVDSVLAANRRGHTAADTVKASRLIKEAGFTLGHQIMPGLYRDTHESIRATIDGSLALKPDLMRVYPCLVVKGTELEKLYRAGEYKPLTLDDAVDVCKDIYKKAHHARVKIIRMGIHPDRGFMENGLVAGPFHPAFKHLVISALFYDASVRLIEEMLGTEQNNSPATMTFSVTPRDISSFIGIKKSNLSRLQEKFPFNVDILQDKELQKGIIVLRCGERKLSAEVIE